MRNKIILSDIINYFSDLNHYYVGQKDTYWINMAVYAVERMLNEEKMGK